MCYYNSSVSKDVNSSSDWTVGKDSSLREWLVPGTGSAVTAPSLSLFKEPLDKDALSDTV